MTFGEIVKHLSGRGFVTRKLWSGWSVMFFGMDNCPWMADKARPKRKAWLQCWVPCLADMKADDWIILPYVWDGSKDDFLPFKKKDPLLTRLRQDRREEVRIVRFKPKNKVERVDPLKPKKPNKSHAGFFGSGGYGT